MPSPLPGRAPWARRCVGLVVALVLALSATACRTGSEPSAAPERPADGTRVRLASHPAETATRIHRVHGRLAVEHRRAVRRQVGRVVDRWWEAAYLGGTYPRTSFPGAFPGFTDGAEARARADKALLTNQTQGPHLDGVSATHREVSLDILAAGERARAVTAQFVLRFETTGTRAGTTTVRGRLFLTWKRGAWRIFGYDVAKGARR